MKDSSITKVNFFSKMGTKIGMITLAMVMIPISILIFMSSDRTTKSMKKTYMSYAQNLAESAAAGVNFAVSSGESTYGRYAQNIAEEIVTTLNSINELGMTVDKGTLDKVLGSAKLNGVESSYAYMVSNDGTMLYHPSADKIGKPVENAAVKGIVADLAAGKKVENGFVIYDYKGAKKLAGYALTHDYKSITIMTADYADFMKVDYDLLIGKITITDVEGSYAYMVASDGTMLYHTNAEKIGKPVENAAVKGIVADIAAGKTIKPGSVVYEYKGENKIAGYCLTNQGNIIIVTADYKTFLKPVSNQKKELIRLGIAMAILNGVVGLVLVTLMMRPLGKVVPEIQNTAKLDFRRDSSADKLTKRKDEIGLIAKEIATMRDNLSDIVGRIDGASESIDANVDELFTVSQQVGDMCADNSSTTEELAAGMQETSASTTTITYNISDIQTNAKGIEKIASQGVDFSSEVKERARNLNHTTEVATDNTMKIYNNVKKKSDVAIKASESVRKINDLTETVMSISSQTSLLALNASIEAARAGEAGRGFSVVATEIGNLATQTSTAVNDINAIVAEVNGAVANMTDCLAEIMSFLETKVIDDYKNFGNVGMQYQEDADSFGKTMTHVKSEMESLNNTLDIIMEAITAINATMGEAACGVSNIAAKTSDIVSGTATTSEKVDECKSCVADLNSIIGQFTLE